MKRDMEKVISPRSQRRTTMKEGDINFEGNLWKAADKQIQTYHIVKLLKSKGRLHV